MNLRVFVSLGIHLIPPCLILFSFLFSQNDYIADLAPVVVWTPPAESDNATNESSTAAAAASTTTTAAASTAVVVVEAAAAAVELSFVALSLSAGGKRQRYK